MAYQNTHPVAATNIFKNVATGVGRFFVTIGKALVNAAEANRRLQGVRQLQHKSDAELQELGIQREDIVHHAFRGVFYV